MDVGRGFARPFEDPKWFAKSALGALIAFVPILQWAIYGAQIRYIRDVAYGREVPLPEWADLSEHWKHGALWTLASVILTLPALAIGMFAFVPLFSAVMASNSGNDPGAWYALAAGGTCVLYALMFVYIVAVSIYVYGATVNYAMKDEFGAFFEFGEVLARIRTPRAGFSAAWIMTLVAGMGLGLIINFVVLILSMIPCLGIVLMFAGFYFFMIAMFMLLMVSGHWFGQYAQVAYGLPPLPSMPVKTTAPQPAAPAYPTQPPVPPAYPPAAPPVAPPQAPPTSPVAPPPPPPGPGGF